MNVCPICLYVNKPDAGVCARCGKFRFAAGGVTVLEPPAVADDAARTRSEGSGSVLTKPSGTVSFAQATRPPAGSDPHGRVDFAAPNPAAQSGTSGVSGSITSRLVVRPRLEVVRGEKLGAAFPVLEGRNVVGRTVTTPVDIDLTGQEPPERVWTSRQHACLIFDGKSVILEDMNSLNGTFVNRQRVFPGQQRVLLPNDVVQVGTVQLRLLVAADTVAG